MWILSFLWMLNVAIPTNKHQLTIEVTSIPNKCIGKKMYIGYWKNKKDFPDDQKAEIGEIIKIESSSVKHKKELPEGLYAVTIFVDLNGNGILDKNFFGVPKEPYCVSNNIKPVFSAPTFDECSFRLNKNVTQKLKLIL